MKKLTQYIFSAMLVILFVSACKMEVIDNPTAIRPETLARAEGALALTAQVLKSGFVAHEQLMWCAGTIGEEEFRIIGQGGQFANSARIAAERSVASDNPINSTNARLVYTTFSLIRDAQNALASSTFSANQNEDTKAKALINANLKMIEGLMYADMCKFYENTPEPGTGNNLSPEEAKTRAIAALQEAKNQWVQYSANTARDASLAGVPIVTGLFTNAARSGEKLVDSYIGMLHFDTGTRGQAAAFLANGYVASDAATQVGYRVINALTGPGVYPTAVNNTVFSINDYSTSFINDRIPGDVVRRGAPVNWFDPTVAIATRINYFFPLPPTTGGGLTPVTRYPLITWQEVALMQAELGNADRTQVISAVLASWGIPAADVARLAADPAITLQRVARYEYIYRGRRWSLGFNANTYRRWPLSFEFNLR